MIDYQLNFLEYLINIIIELINEYYIEETLFNS